MAGYNGWSNYETWNVVLWLSNDYEYYQLMQAAEGDYRAFCVALEALGGPSRTDDGVDWYDPAINPLEVTVHFQDMAE